jgi:hypothetical protein
MDLNFTGSTADKSEASPNAAFSLHLAIITLSLRVAIASWLSAPPGGRFQVRARGGTENASSRDRLRCQDSLPETAAVDRIRKPTAASRRMDAKTVVACHRFERFPHQMDLDVPKRSQEGVRSDQIERRKCGIDQQGNLLGAVPWALIRGNGLGDRISDRVPPRLFQEGPPSLRAQQESYACLCLASISSSKNDSCQDSAFSTATPPRRSH